MADGEISKGVLALLDIETLNKDTTIEEGKTDRAFHEQAATFAYYASIAFKAQRQAAAKKMVMKITEARLDHQLREAAISEAASDADGAEGKLKGGKGKLTERQIEQAIARDSAYVAAQIAYNDAVAVANLCNNALEALQQRRDMLIQIGANVREEMKGTMLMKH